MAKKNGPSRGTRSAPRDDKKADAAEPKGSRDEFDEFPWLAEQLNRPDAVDPELARLRPRINWFRPVLMIAVMVFAGFVMSRFKSELEYYLSPDTPIELGDVTDFPARAVTDPNWAPEIPHNRFVSISGIPSRRSSSCNPPLNYFKLVGGHVYVEAPMDAEMTAIECELAKQDKDPSKVDVQFYSGEGRALSLDRAGDRYNAFKVFYETQFGDLFCSSLTEAKKQQRIDELRQILREQYREKHKVYPAEDVLQQLVDHEPICQNAYLIQDGRKPADNWTYLAIFIGLVLVMMWNVYVLIRWSVGTWRAIR